MYSTSLRTRQAPQRADLPSRVGKPRVTAKPASPAVYRRRRATALVALIALVAVGALALGHGSGAPKPVAKDHALAAPTPKPPELPRGGRTILPNFRVVAYYGAPQDRQLGALGIGTPDHAAKRLAHQAAPYGRASRPVLPALELIAVVAAGAPGQNGLYNLRQPDSVIRRYLKAARKAKALLLLDIQPGRSDFFTEATRLRKWLKQPDVGLALDPEWRMGPGEVPGTVIGKVGAREVNATTAWLAQIVKRGNLPQKLLLVHQFTDDMVPEKLLKRPRGLAYVLNVDGFGSQTLKIAKYHNFVSQAPEFRRGFKLFYQEDANTMTPRQVMRLSPRPDVVVYE
jgi:hypothetical protein